MEENGPAGQEAARGTRVAKVVRETAEAMLPREKLLHGTSAAELTDQELLAVLLKTGTKHCNVLELAGRILQHFGSLYEIAIADWRELREVPGLGTVRSLELYSMFEFGRRGIRPPLRDYQLQPMTSAAQAARFLRPYLLGEMQELFCVLFLDAHGFLMCAPKILTRGTRNASLVSVAEVFREAVKRNARAILVAHNHPFSAPQPSAEDVEVTRQLIAAGQTLDIPLQDHLILGGSAAADDWLSLRAREGTYHFGF